MKTQHMPHHWILVALVLLACLLVVSELHGQSSVGSDPNFQGRPAMAGAQGGLGAMAGPPQGGIGVQGTAGIGPTVRPAIIRNDTVAGPGLANGGARAIQEGSQANRAVVDDARTLRERGAEQPAGTTRE
jgi:hypothetical protein